MIQNKENGANGGNVLDTGDFDTTEEDPQDESEEGSERRSHMANLLGGQGISEAHRCAGAQR